MPSTRARLSVADACTVIGDAGFGARPPGVGLELEWFVVDAARSPRHRPSPRPGRARGRRSAPQREPHHVRARRPARDQHAAVGRRPRCRCGSPRPTRSRRAARLGAAGLARRRRRRRRGRAPPACDRRAALPRDGRVLRRARRGRRHDDARHRVAPGERRLRAPTSTRSGSTPTTSRPVLAAMFANSPLLDGRPSGWQSTRLATWAALDPPRTRPVATAPGARNTWIQYALDAPVMLIRGDDDCTVPGRAAHAARVDPRRPHARPPDRGRRRVPPHHAVPADPPARLARAADARRAARALVARRRRGHRHRARRPVTRGRLEPVVAGARDLWLDAAWHGVHHDGARRPGRRRSSRPCCPPSRASGTTTALIARTEEFAADVRPRGAAPSPTTCSTPGRPTARSHPRPSRSRPGPMRDDASDDTRPCSTSSPTRRARTLGRSSRRSTTPR